MSEMQRCSKGAAGKFRVSSHVSATSKVSYPIWVGTRKWAIASGEGKDRVSMLSVSVKA